jgi:hypothetical protein
MTSITPLTPIHRESASPDRYLKPIGPRRKYRAMTACRPSPQNPSEVRALRAPVEGMPCNRPIRMKRTHSPSMQ